jgi:predicted nucleotidyltransferase
MQVQAVELFLKNFTRWAYAQADIQAAALVGSHARGSATETSDVDLVILARDPKHYLDNQDWIARFGDVLQTQIEDYGRLISIRVWYADGREIEYGLTDRSWAASPLDAGTRRVIEDGMHILFERGPILSPYQTKDLSKKP